MKKAKPENVNERLENYFSLIALFPAFLAIIAYEFLAYVVHLITPEASYTPVNGLGILIPMGLLMECFTFFLTKSFRKKVTRLTNAIREVASGNFNITLDSKNAAPFTEVYRNFNKMTEELKSVESLKSDFINNFSHEFKTPIASINGFAELLSDTALSETERSEYLKIIADESARLTHLAEQTMLISKLDNQTDIPKKESFSLDEQLRQTVILLQKNWSEKQIEPELELEEITFYGNPSLMEHVWMNLLGNAVKFTPENGKIIISAKKENGRILVTVSDTGPGMTEEQGRHIFQKYYQGDTSHSTRGLGLGLSIAHRIVTLCNGTISVTSSPGNGSKFTVTLPTTS